MSVFLTPDLKPIGGGTYFPPDDKYGRRGFKTVLLQISKQVTIKPQYPIVVTTRVRVFI